MNGAVYVALSNGAGFGVSQRWDTRPICAGYYDLCRTGDVDRDGDDDIIVFSDQYNGAVFVQRAQGGSFGGTETWNNYFCIGNEWCDVGDYNGDGRVDIALFTRSTYGDNDRAGDVEVALSNGNNFVNTGIWHNFFCIGSEWCESADVNGDGRDDIVAFTRGTSGNVWVEISTGTGFGDRQDPAELWNGDFCFGQRNLRRRRLQRRRRRRCGDVPQKQLREQHVG